MKGCKGAQQGVNDLSLQVQGSRQSREVPELGPGEGPGPRKGQPAMAIFLQWSEILQVSGTGRKRERASEEEGTERDLESGFTRAGTQGAPRKAVCPWGTVIHITDWVPCGVDIQKPGSCPQNKGHLGKQRTRPVATEQGMIQTDNLRSPAEGGGVWVIRRLGPV